MEKTFGEKVKELMLHSNINQKELSRLSGISESSISRYLSDSLQPRMDIIINIANVFGISASNLLSDEAKGKDKDVYKETITVVTRNRKKLSEKQKAEIIKALFGGD